MWPYRESNAAAVFAPKPGSPGKPSAALLSRYGHIENVPDDPRHWDVAGVRGAERLAATLHAGRKVAELFKDLATLRIDADVGTVDDWEWHGPTPEFADWCARFGSPRLAERAARAAKGRARE
jgi:hypothetical protein